MSTDINGWVEVRDEYERTMLLDEALWYGTIKIDYMNLVDYDMYSSLFGVMPYAPFRPIAPSRGLPHNISESASAEYIAWGEHFAETWVTWEEIAAINWSEDTLDSRPHRYEQNSTGNWVYTSKAAPRSTDRLDEGNTWQVDAKIYKVERISRRDALSSGWTTLFRLMEVLAEAYGNANVRLVVWFDR